ncbi:MAG: hypothetical protein KKA73_14925 [Chloroflexi bacterium]|nr:hypothetical protein [Chloroflexota bacterium]
MEYARRRRRMVRQPSKLEQAYHTVRSVQGIAMLLILLGNCVAVPVVVGIALMILGYAVTTFVGIVNAPPPTPPTWWVGS